MQTKLAFYNNYQHSPLYVQSLVASKGQHGSSQNASEFTNQHVLSPGGWKKNQYITGDTRTPNNDVLLSEFKYSGNTTDKRAHLMLARFAK